MSVTTENTNASGETAPQGPEGNSPARRRVLLYAAAPVVLLILLMSGVRFATDAAQQREAADDEETHQKLLAMRPSDPKSRPTPVPVKTYDADKPTQAALEAVVRGQLKAIGEQDFEKALSYAVPGMRLENRAADFGKMIRSGYAPMLAAKQVSIRPSKVRGRPGGLQQAFVETEIRTGDGAVARYGYILIKGSDLWQISGVMPDRNATENREENVAPTQRTLGPETAVRSL